MLATAVLEDITVLVIAAVERYDEVTVEEEKDSDDACCVKVEEERVTVEGVGCLDVLGMFSEEEMGVDVDMLGKVTGEEVVEVMEDG